MNNSKNNKLGPFVYSTNKDLIHQNLTDEITTLLPNLQKLKVKTDTKQRRGKIVTLIEGFVGKTADAEILNKILKTKCGTGGAVKDMILIIQGDYKNKIIEILKNLDYKVI